MYQSYLCDRAFKDSSEVLNIFRVLRRRCWGDIIQVLDAIAYSKQSSGKDYHNGWIKIEQSKLADKTNYTRSYISTQILELQAIGLLDLSREKFECYSYRFTPLAKEIFRAISRIDSNKFAQIKSLVRDRLHQLAMCFSRFSLAPSEQITSFWSQIRESLTGVVENSTGVVHFCTYKQDPFQEPYQETSTNYTILTGVCDEPEIFEVSVVEQDPEPCLNEIPSPIAAMNLTSTNSPSSEEDLSATTTNITVVTQIPDCDLGSTARFDRQIRTYENVEALTAELVTIYNQIKPEHWGKCSTIGTHLPRQVAALVRRYGDSQLVIQEWGEACLGAKANQFYNSADFKNGNINFLLDPTKTDRIPQLAQAWRDRPQSQKEQLAKKMVSAANGIPTWGNPDVQLKGMLLHFARKEYAGYITSGNFNHPDCPDLDYLKTYFAELF